MTTSHHNNSSIYFVSLSQGSWNTKWDEVFLCVVIITTLCKYDFSLLQLENENWSMINKMLPALGHTYQDSYLGTSGLKRRAIKHLHTWITSEIEIIFKSTLCIEPIEKTQIGPLDLKGSLFKERWSKSSLSWYFQWIREKLFDKLFVYCRTQSNHIKHSNSTCIYQMNLHTWCKRILMEPPTGNT